MLQIDKDLFLQYYNQGFTDNKISNITGIYKQSISKTRRSLNLPRTNRTQYYKEQIIELVSKGYSDKRISDKLDVPYSTIGYMRNRLKIKTNFVERIYSTKEDRIKGYMIRSIKSSARIRNLEFNLVYSDITLPKYCPILEIELDYYSTQNTNNGASVDRIDNNKGYIKGNVLIISRLANVMKNKADFEQLETFSKNIVKIINHVRNQGTRGDITDLFPNKEELNLDL